MIVYMAGPITGCDYEGCTDWRDSVKSELARFAIKGVSPMRGKEYLKDIGVISGTGEEYAHLGPISLPRGVMTRDRWDATRCTALLVNVLGAARVSIGTVMEIAWADLSRIPIICVMEDEGNPHEHMMVTEAIGYRVNNLPQALHILKAMMA